MSNCGVCMKVLKSNQTKLSCFDCKKNFHGVCLKMSKSDVDCIMSDDLVWRCDPCASTRRKSMRFDSQLAEGKLTLDDIMAAVNEIKEGQKSNEIDFNKSFDNLCKKIEENSEVIKSQTNKINEFQGIVEKLTAENRALIQKVEQLETRIEEIEQYSRSNAVEIHGVPHESTEDVVAVVQKVGEALDFNITDSMIDACHRLRRKPGTSGPPAIIVKFVRRLDKEEMLRKRRVKNNLSTRHMNLPVDQPVFINESMSPARRRLHVAAKEIKRNKNYKYLWVRGGKIFIRKEDGSPVININSQADLGRL